MAETQSTVKKWGSSLGVIIPSGLARQERIQEGDEVIIEIKKKKTIRELFGSMKNLKIDSQRMKDEIRKEWSKW
ncbi:MAG: AbrB/MazE/SpoVT family DNA-binding domain-containing protein [Candidatus Aenigmarchaeota archaeon]|nr:AbrB/MazE/SpoVT family DNA-binding domain-containing protein [Candidatus Aenigmarchaeota archaeon]